MNLMRVRLMGIVFRMYLMLLVYVSVVKLGSLYEMRHSLKLGQMRLW